MRGCGGTADFAQLVTFIDRISVKRAIVLVLSDLLDAEFERPLRRLDRRHDVVAVTISDPREERLPERGLVRLVDAETGEARLVDLRRSDISRRALIRSEQLSRRLVTAGVDHLPITTDVPYDRDLVRFFRERVKRRR